MNSRQKSIWSANIPSLMVHNGSFWISIRDGIVNRTQNRCMWSNDISDDREAYEGKWSVSPLGMCIRCCILSSLLAGIILAIVVTLWLTSSTSKTTTVTLITLINTTSQSTTTTSVSTSTTSTSTSTSTTSTSTSTSTTTSIITTTTTPSPPCSPTAVGSSSTLYSTTSGYITNYRCYAYEWISSSSGTVTLAFQLRNDPDYWYVDDVSVYYGGTQMLVNGDFETGSLSPWIKTTPNGCFTGTGRSVSSVSPHSGSYSLADGSNGCTNQISQQFNAIAGETYVVSFWLESGRSGSGSGISATVTLS